MTSRSSVTTARPSSEGRAVARTQTLLPGKDGIGTVRRTTLPGGLRIVTETLPSVRSATFGIWAHVGSRDETPALNGATHYLEPSSSRAPTSGPPSTSPPRSTRSAAR